MPVWTIVVLVVTGWLLIFGCAMALFAAASDPDDASDRERADRLDEWEWPSRG
jgi:hypothetical protein